TRTTKKTFGDYWQVDGTRRSCAGRRISIFGTMRSNSSSRSWITFCSRTPRVCGGSRGRILVPWARKMVAMPARICAGDELDWVNLRRHPKLAQYASARTSDSHLDPTD